ncbi:MAG: PH domain-containing protein [Planctomycetota bacterium]
MPDPKPLRVAEFDPKVKTYWLLSTIILCVVTVIGIPFLIIVIPLCLLFMDRYLDNLACVLTDRTLEIKRGVLSKTESTIPLEKITDLQMHQGPVMRALGLQGFRVETAGQTTGAAGGGLVNMIGIVDTRRFREAVLAQRDGREGSAKAAPASTTEMPGDAAETLRDIRDTLHRIESHLRSGDQGT